MTFIQNSSWKIIIILNTKRHNRFDISLLHLTPINLYIESSRFVYITLAECQLVSVSTGDVNKKTITQLNHGSKSIFTTHCTVFFSLNLNPIYLYNHIFVPIVNQIRQSFHSPVIIMNSPLLRGKFRPRHHLNVSE